jgi:tRNA1(Val) A37 N6-methylase TrmN6
MSKVVKKDNIILRTDAFTHNVIRAKAVLFNRKKSDYLRHCALSHWEDITSTHHFKKLLQAYQEGGDDDKKQVVELLFEYYRRTGFPYTVLTDEQKKNRMGRVVKSKNILLEDDHLQQNPQGLDLANYYHPHMMTVPYSNSKSRTPMETYESDSCLRDCINRWLELGKTPNPAGMRRILKTRNGSRSVVNYKSTIAKFIYDNYTQNNSKVLDPCSGYSGRLIGCIASNKNLSYHGIDPDGRTATGNMECASFFSNLREEVFRERIYKFNFTFSLGCAEVVMPELKENYDLVFTSPPYYNVERYSEESDQSYKKFDSYQKWLSGFLYVIVDESYRLLKDSGKLALNVKNTSGYNIADDLLSYCSEKWNLEKIYHMRLSNNEFHRAGEKMYHTEPIFIFGKK